MQIESYYYSCSRQFIDRISPTLHNELHEVISNLPKRNTQSEVNQDLFWLLTSHGWSYDSVPANLGLPKDLSIDTPNPDQIKESNNRDLCLTTTTLEVGCRADFAKVFRNKYLNTIGYYIAESTFEGSPYLIFNGSYGGRHR